MLTFTPRTVTAAALLSLAALLVGCSNVNDGARRIDPQGNETITTTNQLDVQDATDAAATMSESLLASGILGRNGKPSIIAIDRYINSTTSQIDRDTVIKKIRVSLSKAGVAQTMTTIDSRGELGGESNIATRQQRQNLQDAQTDAFLNDSDVTVRAPVPDYALTYKILEDTARADGGFLSKDVRQITYTFQMTLTDVNTGLAAWEDETQITKQGKQNTVGW